MNEFDMQTEGDEFDEMFSKPKVVKEQKVRKTTTTTSTIKVAKALDHKPLTPEKSINEDKPDDEIEGAKFVGSSTVTDSYVKDMVRREEIEAEIIRKRGRYIESVDNARAGTPYTGKASNDFSIGPQIFTEPAKRKYRAEGVDFSGDILDTGSGAQLPKPPVLYDDKDPRSDSFVTCGNGNCQYREVCLRYRMLKMKPEANTFVFFPEECRIDGIYINIDEHPNYNAYGIFESTHLKETPDLGNPIT